MKGLPLHPLQIEALLNGATALVFMIDENMDYPIGLAKDQNRLNELIKQISPLQVGEEFYVQEELKDCIYEYYILVTNLWQKTNEETYKKATLPCVRINMEYFEESWELLHTQGIPVADIIEEINYEQSRLKRVTVSVEVKRVQDIKWKEIGNIMRAVCNCEDNEENICYFGHDGHFKHYINQVYGQGTYESNPYVFYVEVKVKS